MARNLKNSEKHPGYRQRALKLHEKRLLDGVDVPAWNEKLTEGDVRRRFDESVEELMGRGVLRVSQMSMLVNRAPSITTKAMERVHKKWTATVTDTTVNWRRERLYQEAEYVGRLAWQKALEADDGGEAAAMLRLVLAANQRKSSLTGLDHIKLEVKETKTLDAKVSITAKAEAALDLAPGALAMVGQSLAKAMSVKQQMQITGVTEPTLIEVQDSEIRDAESLALLETDE